MHCGYFSLVLHCHLPFVRHPEHERFLEEDWFFEALTETYLPLLEVFEGLVRDGIPLGATVSVSPPLCEMLTDRLLQERWARYVSDRLELMEEERRIRTGTEFEAAAEMYYRRFRHLQNRYGRHGGEEYLKGLRRLQDGGHLEVITSAATHALLPLLQTPEGIHAQIEQGCRCYEKHFGSRPRGFWLPECGWEDGLDEPMERAGLEFFFLESHGVLLADPRPVHGVFAPIITPAGLAAFGRDAESSKQVWSSDEGYPGDFNYREFHRDLGYDAPYERIKPYLDPWGDRHDLGIKYHRVTGEVPLEAKEPYRPDAARDRALEHARHFVSERCRQVREVSDSIDRSPIIVSPYDAELFGHWWFEGPRFLDGVFRRLAEEESVRPITPVQYMKENPVQQRAEPSVSSWGFEGYFDVWVNGNTDWMYPHLHRAEEIMVELASECQGAQGQQRRVLNQCFRELLLAQSSDWPFLISTRGAPDYARERVRTHLQRFHRLAALIQDERVDEAALAEMEGQDNIFDRPDYRLFARAAHLVGGATD
jgi:1,4-alpha-glucan branching enzyme